MSTNQNRYTKENSFDFYMWSKDIQYAKEDEIKNKLRPKEQIQQAFESDNFSNYPDSDSQFSINTIELNEIHSYPDIKNIEKKIEKKKRKKYCCI